MNTQSIITITAQVEVSREIAQDSVPFALGAKVIAIESVITDAAEVNVFRDGDAWCATIDGFVNLQESVAGFGKTPRDAVADLLQNMKVSQPDH